MDSRTPQPRFGTDPTEPARRAWRRWVPLATGLAVAVAGAVIIIVANSGNDDKTAGSADTSQSIPSDGSAVSVDTTVASSSSTSATATSSPGETTPAATTTAATGSTAPSVTTETTTPTPTTVPGQINLRSAAGFAVLAFTAVVSTGSTSVTGQIGASTGEVSGFPSPDSPDAVVVDPATAQVAQLAVADVAANLDAREQTELPAPVLTEQTIGPGTYGAATLGIAGTVTLDAGGDPSAVFIFETNSSLTVSPASQIILEGGAQACNVYWRVGSANIGTGATFSGTVIANDSIGASGGADVTGRLMSMGGAILLDSAVVAVPTCT